jgi:hypothetical protein
MTANWRNELMSGLSAGFVSRSDRDSEKHDFYCGVDCTQPCEGCVHELSCESSGSHSVCRGCEWQGCCLRNKEAEAMDVRRDSGCLAG